MCVLSCLCLTTTYASSPVDQHIQRINYGIVFEKTHDIYLGQEHWLHTFQIPNSSTKEVISARTLLQYATM